MKKVKLNVVVEKKVDNRVNNTGRPVNKKSARQIRLAKQAFYADVNRKFKKGNQFEVDGRAYMCCVDENDGNEVIACAVTGSYVCNVSYIGRTKVEGYTFVMGKRVNVELNLKTLKFVK